MVVLAFSFWAGVFVLGAVHSQASSLGCNLGFLQLWYPRWAVDAVVGVGFVVVEAAELVCGRKCGRIR